MINVHEFLTFLYSRGFSLATGVPCSYFKNLLLALNEYDNIRYIPATREDEAIGIACGYFFGGKKSVIIMQNSGFATIGDALTSLAQLYKVPLLIFISYRGLKEDVGFPEHSLMGIVTKTVLRAYQLPYWILKEDDWKKVMEKAMIMMTQTSLPVCLLVKKGVFCT